MWVILCRLPEKERKKIEELAEEMKEREREERETGMKVKKQKKLEMCQYDTDAPAQGHPQPHAGILQKMKLKKGTNQSFLKKISEGKHLLKVKKGHNSHNNGLILPYLELDLYFMIIYLCVKFEFNTLMFSKDIKLKLFFNIEKGL